MRRLVVAAASALIASGCTCGPAGGALAIKVDFDSTSLSQCAVVSVSSSKATQKTKALKRPTDNQLVVGVEPTPELSGNLTPSVQGFASLDCTGTAIESASGTAINLDKSGRQEVTLTLRGNPMSDGGPGGGAGGGAGGGTGGGGTGGGDGGCLATAELCQDGLDNDCDGLTDCADPSCLGLGCNDNDACTPTDLCLADGGCGGAPMTCTTPGVCEVAPGACAAGACVYDAGVGLPCNGGGICKSDKTCSDAGVEVFCANAVDDDLDLAIDCADSDCNGQACDAGPSTCFATAACFANACAKMSPVVCAAPGPCFVSTGNCVEGVGCPYALLDAGTPCPTGFCRADGGCTPQELCTNGADDDGDGLADCADPECNALACDDGNGCTTGSTCQGGGCDGGLLCPAISSCTGAGTCGGDGGCQYTIPVFSKCDGGFCRPNGTCGNPFPYTPSNFDPNVLSVPDASVAINCLAEYDSSPGAANNGFVSWCGPQPSVFTLQQGTGGEDIDVLVAPNLVVTDAGSLYLTGARPVVLAVFGNATVDGRVVAGPRPGSNARGAGGSLLSFLAKNHCATGGMEGRANDGTSGMQTSGGGGGGAFGLAGGNGGPGANLANSGGTGGVANGNPTLIPLRGGCPGGLGGNNLLGNIAAGGYGGGAVQMSVGGSFNLAGYLSAPGQPGAGGDNENNTNAGGGGAGSGGGILIEANQLRLFSGAAITALGGGGGEGDGDPNAGQAGVAGQAGHVSDGTPALGGAGGSARGGEGGLGGTATNPAAGGDAGTSGSSRNGGGGGGGASVGRIRLNVVGTCRVDAGSLIAPPFTGTCP